MFYDRMFVSRRCYLQLVSSNSPPKISRNNNNVELHFIVPCNKNTKSDDPIIHSTKHFQGRPLSPYYTLGLGNIHLNCFFKSKTHRLSHPVVCSTISYCIVSGFYHGTAKEANVISVKVLGKNKGFNEFPWVLRGLEWIAKHIRMTASANVTSVINMSLGIDEQLGDYSYLEDCFADIPAVTVVAAGNDFRDSCKYPLSRLKNVITVGSTNIEDKIIYNGPGLGSNYGRCVDILAPGEGSVSATNANNFGEKKSSGTSMGAGYVSGVVAQYLQHWGYQASTAKVREVLQRSATFVSAAPYGSRTNNLMIYSSCYAVDIADTSALSSNQKFCMPHLFPNLYISESAGPHISTLRDFFSTYTKYLLVTIVLVYASCVVFLMKDLIAKRDLRNVFRVSPVTRSIGRPNLLANPEPDDVDEVASVTDINPVTNDS